MDPQILNTKQVHGHIKQKEKIVLPVPPLANLYSQTIDMQSIGYQKAYGYPNMKAGYPII